MSLHLQVVDHSGELKLSLSKGFLVGGDSAGGNLAAVMALQARDDPFFSATPLTGQYLREPVTLHPEAAPEKYKAELRSYEENADAPLLSKAAMYQYLGAFLSRLAVRPLSRPGSVPPHDTDCALQCCTAARPPMCASPPSWPPRTPGFPLRTSNAWSATRCGTRGCCTRSCCGSPEARRSSYCTSHSSTSQHPSSFSELTVCVWQRCRNAGCPHSTHYWFPHLAASAKIIRDAQAGLEWLLSFTKAA